MKLSLKCCPIDSNFQPLHQSILGLIRNSNHNTHSTFRFVFDDDNRSYNHASIYLLTNNGTKSIRLNMALPGVTNSMGSTFINNNMGNSEITHCNYANSNTSVRDFDLEAIPGLRVSHGK